MAVQLSQSQIQNAPLVYDVETPLEAAIAALFTGNGVKAATTATLVTFQNTRPRIELEARLGKGTKKAFGLPNGQASMAFNGTFRCALLIDVITGTTQEGKQSHAAYRALVRFLANTLPLSISLPNHTIQGPIDDLGTISSFKTAEGYETSRLSFEFDLSVNTNVWAQLAD